MTTVLPRHSNFVFIRDGTRIYLIENAFNSYCNVEGIKCLLFPKIKVISFLIISIIIANGQCPLVFTVWVSLTVSKWLYHTNVCGGLTTLSRLQWPRKIYFTHCLNKYSFDLFNLSKSRPLEVPFLTKSFPFDDIFHKHTFYSNTWED